jgi:hypothetical protein
VGAANQAEDDGGKGCMGVVALTHGDSFFGEF